MGRYYYKFSPEGWRQYSSDNIDLSNKIENVWHAFTTITNLNGVFGYSPDSQLTLTQDKIAGDTEDFPYIPY